MNRLIVRVLLKYTLFPFCKILHQSFQVHVVSALIDSLQQLIFGGAHEVHEVG